LKLKAGKKPEKKSRKKQTIFRPSSRSLKVPSIHLFDVCSTLFSAMAVLGRSCQSNFNQLPFAISNNTHTSFFFLIKNGINMHNIAGAL